MKDELSVGTKRQKPVENDPESQDRNFSEVERDPQVTELDVEQDGAAVDHQHGGGLPERVDL